MIVLKLEPGRFKRCCRLLCMIAILGVIAAGDAFAASVNDLEGRWLTGKRKVAISFFPCDGRICGRIDWLAKPRYRGGELKIDRENPDPALRNRPWCGIDVISGLKQKREGLWSGGRIYNPKDGQTYKIEIKDTGEGLNVRAYLGVKLLGKSEDWIRAPDDLPGCTQFK